MDFIRKRIKNLSALITAAAVALTSLPMTAAAASQTEPIKVNVTVEQRKPASGYGFIDSMNYYTDIKEYNLTEDTSVESIAEDTGLLKDFYEIDKWELWGSSKRSGFGEWQDKSYYTVINCDEETTHIGSYSLNDKLSMDSAQNAIDTAGSINKTSPPVYRPLVELTLKPKTYNIKVYDPSVSGKSPVFEFDTDIEGKYFPTAELADGDYLPKLQLDYYSGSDYYNSKDYASGKYSNMKSGDVFWGFVSDIAELEQKKGAEFSFDNLNVYVYKPSITLNITRTGLDYKFFSDGKITADENEYVSEHSTASDVWRVSHGNATYKYEYISGDRLAELVWSAVTNDESNITLDLVDKIYFVNKIGDSLDLIGSEDSDSNGEFRNVIKDNISTYKFGTAPISIEEAARSIGIITKFQTPVKWTVYGTAFWGNDDCYAYMSNESKINIELNSAEDFNFDDNERVFVPIVMINEVESRKFEIPCAEAPGGKLVYTDENHSAFPVKEGVDYWVFGYGENMFTAGDSEELWKVICENIIDKGIEYDSAISELAPPTAWIDACVYAETTSDSVIITAPAGEWVVPKYVFKEMRDLPLRAFIKFSDGITWEINPTTIDLDKMPDGGVDLSVMFSDTLSSGLENVKNTQYKTEVSFKHTGDFGFAATLNIDLSEHMKDAPDGEFLANYFGVNDNGVMEWIRSQTLDQSSIASIGIRRANKLAIIVCRDKLDGSVIRDAEIEITAPEKGGTAGTPTVTGGAVIEKFSWSPEPANGKFAADTAYTLSVYLKAPENTALSGELTATVNGSAAEVTTDENANVIVTYTFPRTAGNSSGGSSSGGSHHSGGSSASSETSPSVNGVSKSWTEIASDISKLPENSNPTIALGGNYNIPAEVIKAIADRNIKAEFVIDSWRSWYIDGADIKNPAAADMTIIQISSLDSSSLRGTVGVKYHINGTNNPAALAFTFKKDYAGRFANLYRMDSGKLVFVGVARVGADGRVMVPASDMGDYVIMLSEYSDLPGDMDNNGIMTAADASEVLKYAVGLIKDGNTLAADIDGDGSVTPSDAAAILKKAIGLM